MNYTAISIGPIISTLSQVRKPRHLWSASYLFSHLMEIIIDEGEKLGGKLISPAKVEKPKNSEDEKETKLGIGLYPDRAFFEGDINLIDLTKNVLKTFSTSIKIEEDKLNNYFNIMGVCIGSSEESKAILELNKRLDALELANRCEVNNGRDEILELITSNKESLLFEFAFDKGEFPVNTLAEIASIETKFTHSEAWENASDFDRLFSKSFSNAKRKSLINEDLFYTLLKKRIPEKLKSYHKYFCVVQADGDNMGKVIGNLQNGKLPQLSEALIAFGKAASKKVKEFGGLPIYAGGDDLLFIAPVVSEKDNIFDLIEVIDDLYQSVSSKAKELQKGEKEDDKIETSMSYGISINYYKYPLYEVLENARNLLFSDAKDNRNSIACELRKHSGSSLKVILNKSNDKIKSTFEELIDIAVEENMVSATAHKLRDNSALWQSIGDEEKRIDAFFKKFMGLGEKQSNENDYLIKVKELLNLLLDEKNEQINQYIYSMLRIAKFINGEEVKDE